MSHWLDANIDVHLVPVLAGFDISCATAGKRGWKGMSNGDLVRATVESGFRCLLTRDQLERPTEPVAGQLIQWP
jgi:hypothetical protein